MPRLKGPVPQVQAKEGPMPQLVKKRRSGWAVLAVGALVASILAFGAAPAAAVTQQADAQATWTACLGPAMADEGFTDVSMDSVHYDNINCLAHYGITTGKTADSYDPGANVTRSQMALFLTRMADVAGVTIDDAMDAGFTDLGDTGSDRVAAINRLANAGIMPGRTATTFDPTDDVTRADMALHLFRFLDLALDSVLIDELPNSVEANPPDGVGHIELNDDGTRGDQQAGDGIGQAVDDYFGDVRAVLPAHMDDIIGAIYELGVTTGTNGMVGEHGTFEPAEPVSRSQMASFIMRALGHTNLRPAGLTAQQTFDLTQVSVRDADFEPIVNASAEVFQSGYARDAFDSRGRCIDRYVSEHEDSPSFETCAIDAGDGRTDVDGNIELMPGFGGGYATITCQTGTEYADRSPTMITPTYRLEAAGLINEEADYKLWAWTGSFGDTVDSDTQLFEAVPANQQHRRTAAVTAVFSGGTRYDVKMGSALVYEIQLVDREGRPVGPNPTGNQAYNVTIQTRDRVIGQSPPAPVTLRSVETRTPDSDGYIRIVVTHPDPIIGDDSDPDVEVSVMVERHPGTRAGFANTLRFVDTTGAGSTGIAGFELGGVVLSEGSGPNDATGPPAQVGGAAQRRFIGAQAPLEVFSDEIPEATSISVSPGAAGREHSSNRNSLSVTVLDQYGNPYMDGDVPFTATSVVTLPGGTTSASEFPNNGDAASSRPLVSNSGGRIYFNYNYVEGAGTEVVTITGGSITSAATVYWAEIASRATGRSGGPESLLLADPSTRRLVVDTDSDGTNVMPEFFLFGADDEFIVGQSEQDLSLEQFQEVLMVAVSPSSRITLNHRDPPTSTAPTTQTTLSWERFDNTRPTDRATWTLAGLHCTPPPGADAESFAT